MFVGKPCACECMALHAPSLKSNRSVGQTETMLIGAMPTMVARYKELHVKELLSAW